MARSENLPALLLGQRRIGSASEPNSATMKGTLGAIRPAKNATSRERRSSLDKHRTLRLARCGQCCDELWPAVERIGAFPGFDLGLVSPPRREFPNKLPFVSKFSRTFAPRRNRKRTVRSEKP